jgi:hypothetical protein
MNTLFKKLNYKDQSEALILHAPTDLWLSFKENNPDLVLKNDLLDIESISFVLVFLTDEKAIADFAETAGSRLTEDAVVWMCYPKKTSKKYKSEINRDSGWDTMGKLGMEPVRQVAIDEDWSALRFRFVDNIKNLTRRKSMTLTDKAKGRTTGN